MTPNQVVKAYKEARESADPNVRYMTTLILDKARHRQMLLASLLENAGVEDVETGMYLLGD